MVYNVTFVAAIETGTQQPTVVLVVMFLTLCLKGFVEQIIVCDRAALVHVLYDVDHYCSLSENSFCCIAIVSRFVSSLFFHKALAGQSSYYVFQPRDWFFVKKLDKGPISG